MHIGFLNLLAAAFLQASASAPSPSSPILLLFERALTMRDTVALTRAVDSSVIFHSRGRTDTLPREALWQLSQPILTAFPDIRFVVEDEIRAGQKIAARVTFTGTHRGPWQGVQPTGRVVRVSEMFICRLRKERLVECWQEWDEYGLREQLRAQ